MKQSGTTGVDSDKDGFSARHMSIVAIALLVYFGIRLVYFAFSISPFVPPDEVTHFGKCVVFSKTLLFPENSSETYEYGIVTNIPWLYYWVMGKLLALNFSGLADLTFLRLCNVPLAFGTICYARRMLSLLTDDSLTQVLLVAVMTNTLMFTFLSASVTSDNLTNLLATMSIYYLFAFLKFRSGTLLALSFTSQLAGSLVKNTSLLLSFLLLSFLLASEYKSIFRFPAATRDWLLMSGRRGWFLLAGVVILLMFAAQLHVGNYLRFGLLDVGPDQVFKGNEMMQYRIGAREEIFRQFRDGKISYTDALLMTSEIKHVGDRSDTVYLLMNYENLKQKLIPWLSLPEYIKVWYKLIWSSTFGIKGHRSMPPGFGNSYLIAAMIFLAGLGFVLRWRPRQSGWLLPSFVLIAVFYAAYLLFQINYKAYLHYGNPGPTLNGRYLFPVLAPWYACICYCLMRLFGAGFAKLILASTVSILFIAYDFPHFLAHVTPEWFQG